MTLESQSFEQLEALRQDWWAEDRKGEIPDFVESEFETWWFEFYNGVTRDRRTWGVPFIDRYDDAKRAWIEAYQRGLAVNY